MRGDDVMSAIGLTGGSASSFRAIGSRADFRHEHFHFARTQSRALREVKWEARIKPLHSWSEILLYVAGGIVVTVALLSFVA